MDKQVQPSSLSNEFKRKRHRKQPEVQAHVGADQHYVCVICNDEALSYNFGVICCEVVRLFYRRSLTSKRTYACANGGRCEINRDTRKFCPHCRMQKCLNAGMSSDPLTIAYLDAVRTGSCARRTLQRRKERASASSRAHTLSGDTQHSSCGQSGLNLHSQSASPAAELPSSVVSSFSQPASAVDVGPASVSSISPKLPCLVSPLSRDKLPPHVVKIETCSTTTPSFEPQAILPKWRKLRQMAELEEFSDADYDDSVIICGHFAQIMQEPFRVEDLGPVSENMMPDDPVAMSRFPEATLRRYISALKKVPEFQQKFVQTERFWMLRSNLLRQQAVVIAYFADPFDRCFYGSVANGATFRHPVEYSIEQFSRAGIDTTHLYDLMMKFYAHIRERFPSDAEWPVVAAFLCIVKLFSPEQFDTVDSSSRAAAELGVDVALLSGKSKEVYRKYKIMFMRYVQHVKDLRAGHAPSRNIDTEVYSFCDRLLTEACSVCTLCASTVEKLTRSFRDSSDSQDYVPLWLELNSA